MYVRHGEPADKVIGLMYGMMPNETWVYQRADGNLLLHYSSGGQASDGADAGRKYDEGGDIEDYRLVPSVFDLRGDGRYAHPDMVLSSRAQAGGRVQQTPGLGPLRAGPGHGRGTRHWEASIAVGTMTDDNPLTFESTARGRGGSGRRGTIREPKPPLGGVRHSGNRRGCGRRAPAIPFRLRLSVFGPAGAVAVTDTSLLLHLPRGIQPGGLAVGSIAVPVPPGDWT